MPVVPFIPAAIGAVSAIGSAIGGSGSVKQSQTGPQDVGPLRNSMMQFLLHGQSDPNSQFSQLSVPGFNNGQPNPELDAINKMFDATRAEALGQAKESAGNLTGSGNINLFGSALAQSLAAQQKQLADAGMQGAEDNQKTFANLFSQFGANNVGSQGAYQPSGFASLGSTAGPMGQLLSMFGGKKPAAGSNVSTDPSTAPVPYTGATFNGQPTSGMT